jgi:hypothetical protein
MKTGRSFFIKNVLLQ